MRGDLLADHAAFGGQMQPRLGLGQQGIGNIAAFERPREMAGHPGVEFRMRLLG